MPNIHSPLDQQPHFLSADIVKHINPNRNCKQCNYYVKSFDLLTVIFSEPRFYSSLNLFVVDHSKKNHKPYTNRLPNKLISD